MAVAVREFLLAATIAAAVQYHPVSGMERLTKTRPNNIRAASIPSPVLVETQPPLQESNDRGHPEDTRPLLSSGVSQDESKFIEQRLYLPDLPRDSTENKDPFVTHIRNEPRTTTRKPMPIRNFEEVKSRYKLFEGLGYYRVIKSPRLRWSDARVACAEDGAHLAVINSPEEARALVMTYHELGVKGDIVVQQAYVGVSDSMKEGDYVTIFGKSRLDLVVLTTLTGRVGVMVTRSLTLIQEGRGSIMTRTPLNATGFSSWAPGELSKEAHILQGKDCLTLHTSGYLKVVNCRAPLPYFCEHELDGKNNNII
uniref:C-type lectin domain-containing protein n=1 Tax=Timema cristinae TaxID=61476 RepID=A0A7R9GTY4_TIMCR|nr:unnamed protein product [Timema cristinae]